MAKKFKYIWVSADGVSFSIPKRLQEEGETVFAVLASDWKNETAWGVEDKEKTDLMKQRHSGMLNIKSAKSMLTAASSIKDKEAYRVICDTNALWPVAEKFKKMGFKGLLPSHKDHDLEEDRNGAKKMVDELYKDLETGEHQEFKSIDEVEEYFTDNEDKFYVAKGNHEDTSAIVPSVQRADWNHNEILTSLRADANYEKGGIALEEKVMDIVEFCPEAISYDGKVVGVNIDVENKPVGAGNEGFQTGDSSSTSMWITEGEIYEKFLKPLEDKMLRKGELTYWDANVAYSPSRQKFYFLEYCPNRMGYDAIWNELATMPSVAEYYERIFDGEQVFQADVEKYGSSIRLFNLKKDKDQIIQTEKDDNIWLVDVKSKDDQNFIIGYDEFAAVITGAGDELDESFDEVYETLDKVGFSKGYRRPKHDVMSYSYVTSIPNRFQTLSGLFKELGGPGDKSLDSIN